MEKKQGLEHVILRNHFYWESCRRVELAVVLLFVLIVGLFAFISYQSSTFPPPQYFATTPDGRPIPRITLNVPLQTPATVIDWSEKAITKIYSLDFVNFRRTLQDAQIYFTLRGYLEFKQAFNASRNLEAVKENRQVVSAEIVGVTKLIREGQLTDSSPYSWNLEIPITVTYQNSNPDSTVIKQTGKALIRVERTTLVAHAEGIAIAQLILQAD